MATLFYQGYAGAVFAIASPWIARSFGLDQSGIARVFALLALSSLLALTLSRMVDRVGRRRVLLWSTAAMPLCALGTALSANLVVFVLFGIALSGFTGAAASASIVMIAETLPIARRAEGQSLGGLAAAAGSGLCVLLMPALIAAGWSWRWLLAPPAVAIALLPPIARALPESRRWVRTAGEGEAERARFYDVFIPLYRKRSITMLVCTLMAAIVGEAIGTWGYFHVVSVLGLSAGAASTVTIVGGGLGLAGFPVGARLADGVGRVPTIVASGLSVAAGALLFYWGPPAHFAYPVIWLVAAFFLLNLANNATTVASNAAVTELFPTALRGTMIGWLTLLGAMGSLGAEVTISSLALRLGSLSAVVGYLAILAVPGSILFGILIDETRGMSLEESAREEAFRESGPSR